MNEGILVCGAPHCLKSFLKKDEFNSHVHKNHAELLHPNARKEEGNESEAVSARNPTTSDSTVQAPPRAGMQPKLEPPFLGQMPNYSSDTLTDNNRPQGFDRPDPHNSLPQQNVDSLGGWMQESAEFQDKQQGVLPESPFPDYAMQFHQPPNNAVPTNSNLVLAPPQFSYPQFAPDGAQPYYGAPFQTTKKDSAPGAEPRQGSLLGFPPGAAGVVNFSGNYPQPWNVGVAGVPLDPSPSGRGHVDGFNNISMSETQGKVAYFQGNCEQNPGVINLAPLPTANKGMEPVQGQNAMDPRDSKGILIPPPPPPPSQSPHVLQVNRGNFFSGRDAQGSGWLPDQRDTFGGGRD